MRVVFFITVLIFLVHSSFSQCTCSWIEKNKESNDLISIGSKGWARPIDELSVGLFRHYNNGGFYLLNSKGNEIFPNRFDRIEAIYADSSFIGITQGERGLYKFLESGKLSLELTDFQKYWAADFDHFYFLKKGHLYSRIAYMHNDQIGDFRNDSIFIFNQQYLKSLSIEFFYGAWAATNKIFLQDSLQVKSAIGSKLILRHPNKNHYYTYQLNREKTTSRFYKIQVFDTLYWKRNAYWYGQDSESVYYLPKNPSRRLYALPLVKSYHGYKNLTSKNLTRHILYPIVVQEGNRSLLFLNDTFLIYRKKLEVIDMMAGNLSLVDNNGSLGILNSDSLVQYQLEGGVINIDACIQYIVTEDDKHIIHIYSLKGEEITSTGKRGYLVGRYYFDEQTHEMLFKLKQ